MSTSLITEPFLRKSFTLIELLIVLVILGVLFSMATFNSVLEKERNARMNLKLAFQAEKDAFAYSAPEERYTTSWKKLLCGDLNEKDRYFSYTIEVPSKYKFNVTATNRSNPSRFLSSTRTASLKTTGVMSINKAVLTLYEIAFNRPLIYP